MNTTDYHVCVRCMTYNQSAYICDTLDGFTMQWTSFPYVCVVVDDASTDGEQEVIKKYLSDHFEMEDKSVVRNEETIDYVMSFARHKENQNCYFAVYFLKYNHYGKKAKYPYFKEFQDAAKYLANCEGDDYWTEPRKLQIQYDYLEAHPHVVLSCHRYSIHDLKTGETKLAADPYFDQKGHHEDTEFEFDLNYYLNVWVTKYLTCMFRRDAVKKDWYKGFKYARDVHFFYYIMTKGRGVCHAFNGGVYRKNVSTSIFGNLTAAAQTSINSKVYEELAEVTQNPIVRKTAYRLIVADCINRLRGIGGGYYYAIKILVKFNRFIDNLKHGFKRLQPITN